VPRNSRSATIAWLAAVRTRCSERNWSRTVELFSTTFRWSASSFWMNVELVDHSSASSPPNSHVLSPDAVAVRSRPRAPM
jgi:hypothetical protein